MQCEAVIDHELYSLIARERELLRDTEIPPSTVGCVEQKCNNYEVFFEKPTASRKIKQLQANTRLHDREAALNHHCRQ